MTYLSASEYEAFGLAAATADTWIAAASTLIDQYCRRPTLAVQQYVERLRLISGRNTVQLAWLPLAIVDPATSPIVSARARWAMPRRGEQPPLVVNPALAQLATDVAQAFALPGTSIISPIRCSPPTCSACSRPTSHRS